MPLPIPRLGRALDFLGLILVAVGGGCYGYSYLGLERIRTGKTVLTGTMFATLNEARALERVSDVGLAVAVAGIGVCIAAFVVTRYGQRPMASGA